MTETVSLTWPNKDQLLIAKGETDYQWTSAPPEPVKAMDRGRIGTGDTRGIIACGDALDVVHALTADETLGDQSVKLVYIDPPFGAQKRFGHYRDQLSTAAWLSMMKDRLAALAPTLHRDASVWVHLDETMVHRARLVLDELFGADAYVATVIWQKRQTVESRTAVSTSHDPILVYAPSGPRHWKKVRNRITGAVSASNRDGDPRGPWRDAPFTAPGYRANQQYTIVNPAGIELRPPRGRSWFATRPVFEQLVADGRIWWTKGGAGQPRMKNYDIDARQVPGTIWTGKEVGTNDDAKRHLARLFPDVPDLFDTPKPEGLLKRIIEIGTNEGDLVVDLFGGSGTTAAVAHSLRRRWITAERLVATVTSVLIPRLSAVHALTEQAAGSASAGAIELVQVKPRLGTVPELPYLADPQA